MNRIRLLSEQVANQIAAGEVVERPASVVKELVENALDAGSTHIEVEIQGGGRSLIRVTDDGFGMSRDDALMCLERHATSKIVTAHDLAAVTTMGFRGEALPSIASVSRFTLTTRERNADSPEGTQLIVQGGKLVDVQVAGRAPGTTVEVRQLFYNLPARRKFLRTEETERAHIQHYVTLVALAHPEVGFNLIQDQRLLWQFPPMPADRPRLAGVRDRLRTLLGPELPLLPLEHEELLEGAPDRGDGDEPEPFKPLRVWGFVGAPGVSRATREDQHLFVNRRPIENRRLNFALVEGYHTALMKGRYPVACLFLELDPAEVDVNVHPAKREVRFHREQDVRRAVERAVRQCLLQFHAPDRDVAAPGAPAPNRSEPPTAPEPREAAVVPPTRDRPPAVALGTTEQGTAPVEPSPRAPWAPDLPHFPPADRSPAVPPAAGDSMLASSPPRPAADGVVGPTPLLSVPLRMVGVVGRLYVVLESDRGLVLMDQHAAHERILYEQMLHRLESGAAPSQRLLLPETVELAPRDAQFLRDHLAVLVHLGVSLSEFGERTFLLDGLPPFVRTKDTRGFVRELVDELRAAGQEVNALRLGEQVVAKTVCRHAVKANDPLSLPELENLLEDLRRCAMPYTCPHGRPTLIELGYRELEKKFGRIA